MRSQLDTDPGEGVSTDPEGRKTNRAGGSGTAAREGHYRSPEARGSGGDAS